MDTYNFETALSNMKEGKKVAREGWNGKGMFVFLAYTLKHKFETKADLGDLQQLDPAPKMLDCLVMKNAENNFVLGWLASQTDLLAEDWYTVGEKE